MSVRSGLMALLAEGEKYGAQLRSEFEARTGGTWPLNVGQVYTTLDRLVRDGLVESAGTPDADGRIAYRLTPGGHAELGAWWVTPVDRTNTPRDELTIKLALAVTAPGVDVQRVVQAQRTATLRHLHDLTRLKRESLGRAEGAAEGRADADADAPTPTTAWPGCSCSRTSSSPRRRRCAGSTTSRRCWPADPRERHPPSAVATTTRPAADRRGRAPSPVPTPRPGSRRRSSPAAHVQGGPRHEHRTARRHHRRHPHPRQ